MHPSQFFDQGLLVPEEALALRPRDRAMMKYSTLSVVLGSAVVVGCTSGPSLRSASFKVSTPVSGVVTVSSIDRISDSSVPTVRLAIRPSGSAQGASPLLSTVVPVNSNGMFDPVTMGSSASPVLSGQVLSAEVWNSTGSFWMMAGPAITVTIPKGRGFTSSRWKRSRPPQAPDHYSSTAAGCLYGPLLVPLLFIREGSQ